MLKTDKHKLKLCLPVAILAQSDARVASKVLSWMSLDSVAVFQDRVNELGPSAHSGRFTAAGWDTYASLAFSTSYIPGTDEAASARDIVTVGLGSENHADKKALRRLFFDAYTLAAADLKSRADTKSDDAPSWIPYLERQAGRDRVAARLTGLDLTDELDCSNRLVDKAIEIYEDNVIRYLGLEECTKMEMELRGIKKDPMFLPDAQGVVRMKCVAKDSAADVTTELKLSYAFKRRGLAAEMGDILAYESHDKLLNKLMRALLSVPLECYAKFDVKQALQADIVAWKLIAERTRHGIKRNVRGERPCDLVIDMVLGLSEITQAL